MHSGGARLFDAQSSLLHLHTIDAICPLEEHVDGISLASLCLLFFIELHLNEFMIDLGIILMTHRPS